MLVKRLNLDIKLTRFQDLSNIKNQHLKEDCEIYSFRIFSNFWEKVQELLYKSLRRGNLEDFCHIQLCFKRILTCLRYLALLAYIVVSKLQNHRKVILSSLKNLLYVRHQTRADDQGKIYYLRELRIQLERGLNNNDIIIVIIY